MIQVLNPPIGRFEAPAIPVGQAESQGYGHGFKIVVDKVRTLFIYIFQSIGEVFNKRSSLSKICKLTISILTGIAHHAGHVFRGAGLLRVLGVTDTVLDACDIMVDADGIVNKRFVEEGRVNQWSLMANIALLTADVMGMFLWLDELAFISLSKISASIGNGFSQLAAKLGPGFTRFTTSLTHACPFLAKVAAKVTLLNVLRGVVIGAFCALAINEARHLVTAIHERNVQKILVSSLYIASFVAEIALKILAIAGCTFVPGLVVVGCLAAGLGLAGIMTDVILDYRKKRAQEIAQPLRLI